ncbi:MAG TPA: DNA starvation/stationary phase protection protein DpsA [Candidatus Polarisedimenticolia bacterium]|nr:DNA starvation/stationary phase protection protein DpsA [Candidatus Polarisedimenticolia bacterium]
MTHPKHEVIQDFEKILGNPIGLTRKSVEPVIKALNKDLATTYSLYHQYKKHHWLVVGPQFRDLHLFLDDQAKGALLSADLLAERVTALGGVPLSSPARQEQEAAFTFEEEGSFTIRQSLEHDMEAERQLILLLRRHVQLADKHGDPGSAHLLRTILLRHEDQAHHIEHFLGEDTLEAGGPT